MLINSSCIMDSFFGFSAPILEHIIGAISDYQFRYVSISWIGGSPPPSINQSYSISVSSPYVVVIFGLLEDTTAGPFLRWPGGSIIIRDEYSSSQVVKWAIKFHEQSFTIQSGGYSNSPQAHTFTIPMLFAFIDPRYVLTDE